jgi:hypothetical protein
MAIKKITISYHLAHTYEPMWQTKKDRDIRRSEKIVLGIGLQALYIFQIIMKDQR